MTLWESLCGSLAWVYRRCLIGFVGLHYGRQVLMRGCLFILYGLCSMHISHNAVKLWVTWGKEERPISQEACDTGMEGRGWNYGCQRGQAGDLVGVLVKHFGRLGLLLTRKKLQSNEDHPPPDDYNPSGGMILGVLPRETTSGTSRHSCPEVVQVNCRPSA